MCLPSMFVCDGINDCFDGADEDKNYCSEYPRFFFVFSRSFLNNCITAMLMRLPTSLDYTVENISPALLHLMNLPMKYFLDFTCKGEDQFQCANGKCLPRKFRCDGEVDCADGKDESSCGKYFHF